MTSEPDSKPGRRPPTIELKATVVDQSASPQDSGAAEAPADRGANANDKRASAPSRGRLKSHVLSAFGGGIGVAAIVAGLWYAGLAPSREPTPNRSGSQTATANDVAARLDKIEGAIKAQRQDATAVSPAAGNRLAAAEAQTKSLADSVAALSRRVDDIAATAQTAQQQAGAASAAVDAAKSAGQENIQRSDLDALTSRIAALETAVKTLSDTAAQPVAGTGDRAARLTIAAEALRAAVEREAPYQAALAAVQSLGVGQNATGPLEPFAASGIPSAAALVDELAMLLPDLRRASDIASGDVTFLGRIEANAQKLVRITPLDAPVGNDPSAVIARLGVDAGHGDIDAALTDIAVLPEAVRPLAADWAKRAQARNAAIATSRRIVADALAALGKPAAQ